MTGWRSHLAAVRDEHAAAKTDKTAKTLRPTGFGTIGGFDIGISGESDPAGSLRWHPADAGDAAEREAIGAEASAPLPDPGTFERQRLDHDHAQAVAGLLEAARKRPPSWADPASFPGTSTFCACCHGTRWWGDDRGWRCATCHPRANGYRPDGGLREVQS